MLRMAGDPMIETTIAKGNTLNHFNFVIDSFNRTIGVWRCERIFNVRLIHFKGLKSGLKFRRDKRVFYFK